MMDDGRTGFFCEHCLSPSDLAFQKAHKHPNDVTYVSTALLPCRVRPSRSQKLARTLWRWRWKRARRLL